MKISLNWLKEYIPIEDTPELLGERLTQTGLEVEAIEPFEQVPGGLAGIVIGKVMTCEKHPNADKLKVTTVDVGKEEFLSIVCGAPNVASGQTVVVATVGTMLYPSSGEPFKIKKSKIRGALSEGMICAEDEIGLGASHDGIIVIEEEIAPGLPASTYYHLQTDSIVEIGLTPNRADAISHLGVARDIKAISESDVNWPDVSAFKVDNNSRPVKVTVEDVEACPRYSGLTMTNIKVQPSPDWLQIKLKSIGLMPINAVVDVTNFVCHEMGQPLHAFDLDQIQGNEVIVKTLPQGTTFTTLDEKERKLNSFDLMICNQQEGMCIAGVFGGIKSGVTDKTTQLFLEGAYFSADVIRKTSMAHGLKTDASFRYERGTDPRITVYAIQRAALLIKEICGGEISSEIFDHYPNPVEDATINVKYAHIDRLIGQKIDKTVIHKILNRLDIASINQDENGFEAIVPPYRVDVKREADIIEEILRIYGYNNIELPEDNGADFLSAFPKTDKEQIQFRTSEMLSAMGFNEIMTNSLTKSKYAAQTPSINESENVVIMNKLSEDLDVMKQDMVFTGLESVAYNINRRQKQLMFFEFGKKYKKLGESYKETAGLSIFMTGNAQEENWINKARQLEFHDLSSVVERILNKFNIKNASSRPVDGDMFAFGLQISLNEKEIVAFGRLAAGITKQVGIDQPVWYANFNWEYLLKQSGKQIEYKEISKFPEVARDLSLVLDKQIKFEDVRSIAVKSENKLLRDIKVFDVYEGDSVGKDKKAYAIKFILQDQHKTLTDKVIDKTMSRLMGAFENELGAIIRK